MDERMDGWMARIWGGLGSKMERKKPVTHQDPRNTRGCFSALGMPEAKRKAKAGYA